MKTKTKETLLRAATAAAVVCAAALVFVPAVASAAPAVATSALNVRSGPGTSFRVIDTLRPGEQVDVGGCRSGWCYLTDEDGFVSSAYLRRGSSSGATIEPNFNLRRVDRRRSGPTRPPAASAERLDAGRRLLLLEHRL